MRMTAGIEPLSRLSWFSPSETSVNFKLPFVLDKVIQSDATSGELTAAWSTDWRWVGSACLHLHNFQTPEISKPWASININPIAVSRNEIRGFTRRWMNSKVALEAVDKFVPYESHLPSVFGTCWNMLEPWLEDGSHRPVRSFKCRYPSAWFIRILPSRWRWGRSLCSRRNHAKSTSRLRRSIRLPGGSSIAAFCTSAEVIFDSSRPAMLKHTAVKCVKHFSQNIFDKFWQYVQNISQIISQIISHIISQIISHISGLLHLIWDPGFQGLMARQATRWFSWRWWDARRVVNTAPKATRLCTFMTWKHMETYGKTWFSICLLMFAASFRDAVYRLHRF